MRRTNWYSEQNFASCSVDPAQLTPAQPETVGMSKQNLFWGGIQNQINLKRKWKQHGDGEDLFMSIAGARRGPLSFPCSHFCFRIRFDWRSFDLGCYEVAWKVLDLVLDKTKIIFLAAGCRAIQACFVIRRTPKRQFRRLEAPLYPEQDVQLFGWSRSSSLQRALQRDL